MSCSLGPINMYFFRFIFLQSEVEILGGAGPLYPDKGPGYYLYEFNMFVCLRVKNDEVERKINGLPLK